MNSMVIARRVVIARFRGPEQAEKKSKKFPRNPPERSSECFVNKKYAFVTLGIHGWQRTAGHSCDVG